MAGREQSTRGGAGGNKGARVRTGVKARVWAKKDKKDGVPFEGEAMS